MSKERIELWRPSKEKIDQSNMKHYMDEVSRKYHLSFKNYREFQKWSVDHPEDFWDSFWKWSDVKVSKPYEKVVDDIHKFNGTKWFKGCKMNYAENMLRYASEKFDETAIVFRGETKVRREITWKELDEEVKKLATALRHDGVKPGDRVSAYMPNMPETVIAMLATASVGAIWCSAATDIGPRVAIDRLGQIKPKFLFTVDAYYYKGKTFDVLKKAAEVKKAIPTIQKVIVAHYAGDENNNLIDGNIRYEDYINVQIPDDFQFEQMDASAPLVVMFSSGTTGKPKCMVQSAGGLLINQFKELILHHDVKPTDKMLYITTCSWMMWNWMLASLGAGCSLILFDGNPSFPDSSAIFNVLDEEKVTIFGLSASYIHGLMAEGFLPKDNAMLTDLREISQTGSALSDAGFHFVYDNIKRDLYFNSIAGGTDINGCFAIGNPLSPIYSNELMGPGLGMKINCFDGKGNSLLDEQGELVCEMSEPSMPIYFWDDQNNERYYHAYFDVYPSIWRHGDYVMLHSDTGGITYYGRSDSVLKPSGVRIGTAEIYEQVQKVSEVEDSLAIGQEYHGDQRILLFVDMKPNYKLNDEIKKKIKTILRINASPRHVPDLIIEAPDIPRTLNGKKVESAVTNIINGRKVTNRDSLENPECLKYYENVKQKLNQAS